MIIKPEEQRKRITEQSVKLMQTQLAEDRLLVTDDVIRELESTLDLRGSLHDRFVMGTFYVKSRHEHHIRRGIQMLTDLLRYGEPDGTRAIPRHSAPQSQQQRPQEDQEYDDTMESYDPNRTVLLGHGNQQAAAAPAASEAAAASSSGQSEQKSKTPIQPIASADPFHQNRAQYKRDCLYFVALGYYNLEDYPAAKRWLEHLLRINPKNEQAQRFMMLVDKQIEEQGKRGLAIAAVGATAGAGIAVGALAIGAAVLFSLMKK